MLRQAIIITIAYSKIKEVENLLKIMVYHQLICLLDLNTNLSYRFQPNFMSHSVHSCPLKPRVLAAQTIYSLLQKNGHTA